MKKALTICILLLALFGTACKKSDSADTTKDPIIRIIEYSSNGGNVLADITPASNTDTLLRFYGLRSANGAPEKLTAISVKTQDTIANYILDEKERVKYVYGSVKGALINQFMKIDYLADSTVSISTFSYNWDQGNATYESTHVYRYVANTWQPVNLRMSTIATSNGTQDFGSFLKNQSPGFYLCVLATIGGAYLMTQTAGLARVFVIGLVVSCWSKQQINFAHADTQVSNNPPPNTFSDPEVRRNEIAGQSYANKSIVKFSFTGMDCYGITTAEYTGSDYHAIDFRNSITSPYYVFAYDCSSLTPFSMTLTCSGISVKKTAPGCQ